MRESRRLMVPGRRAETKAYQPLRRERQERHADEEGDGGFGISELRSRADVLCKAMLYGDRFSLIKMKA